MIVVTCHASVYTLVLMSIDRYMAVCRPISSITIRTQRNALLFVYSFAPSNRIHEIFIFRAIAITWILVLLTAIPVAFSHGEVSFVNLRNEINMACLFLAEEGYNHAAFQVCRAEN